MTKLILALLVIAAGVSAHAQEVFPPFKQGLLNKLEGYANKWKDNIKARDDYRSHFFDIDQFMRNGNLALGSDYDYETRSGTIDVSGEAGGMRHTFRYVLKDGKVTDIALVTGAGPDDVTPIWRNGQEIKAGMDGLHRRFLEFCRVAIKGEQMHGLIPPLAGDKNQSIEKILKSVTGDWGGLKKATAPETFPKFREALFKRLKDAGVEVSGRSAEELIVPYEYTFFKEGTWAWQKSKEVTETYVELKFPFAKQRYVFDGKNVGIVNAGIKYQAENYPRKDSNRMYPFTEPKCSRENLEAAVRGLARGTPDDPAFRRAEPAAVPAGTTIIEDTGSH